MMADYAGPPRHSAVMERLRRRIELFRRHHSNCESRYDRTALERLEMDRQQTFALHQRCLQSKAKRSNKHRQSQPASEQAALRGAGHGGGNADGDGGTGEQSRNDARIALQETVKRKQESTSSPISGEVNGFGDGYPKSKQVCLEESRQGVNSTGNGAVPPRSPLDTKHGIIIEPLPNGTCSQGAEQNSGRISDSVLPPRDFKLKQEPMDDILTPIHPGGSPNDLLPDLNLNEQEWRELMEEFNRSVPYEDIQDIFKDGFDERKDPELATPNPLPQTPLAPEQVNIKVEFSPASVTFDPEPRTVSPQVRPTSGGPALHTSSPVTCPSNSTVPSSAMPVSQPVRQLPQNLQIPGPSSKDRSHAQHLQQLAAREQQRTQLMQQAQQQQQVTKYHPPNHQTNHQAGWTQTAPSPSQLAGAYTMEKPNSPALYQQDISNPKQLMMPNPPHKNSPKGAESYPPAAGHSVPGQPPLLDYNNTRPLSHFHGSRVPSAAPLATSQQNKAALLSKPKAGLPFRSHLTPAQEQSPYPPASHVPCGTSQPPGSALPGSHNNSAYPNVSLETRKQFLSHQQLMQNQQMQRHLTRPPPQYQDQNCQNPFQQQQQQVAQFAGSSQKLNSLGSTQGTQRMFPGVMGMAVGQNGGPTSAAPPAPTLAEMNLSSCVGGGLDTMRVPYGMNPHPGQGGAVNSTPLQRQPAGPLAATYRPQHMARMPTSMPNPIGNGMVNSMPNSISTSMPNSVPNGMPNTLPNTMPNSMPNPMPSGMPTSMPSSMPTQTQPWQAHSSMQQALGQQAPGGNGGMQVFSGTSYRIQPRLPKLPNNLPFAQAGLNNNRAHSTVNSPQMMASLSQQRANPALAPQPHPRPLAPPSQQQQQHQQQQQVLPGISVPMPDMAGFVQNQGNQVGSRPSLQCNQGYQVSRTANHELAFAYSDQAGGSLPSFPEESDLVDSLLKGPATQEWMDDLDELLASHQ
nr:mastermind-like protein 1 isoform X2 [Paramormyrops kingsleyae]